MIRFAPELYVSYLDRGQVNSELGVVANIPLMKSHCLLKLSCEYLDKGRQCWGSVCELYL